MSLTARVPALRSLALVITGVALGATLTAPVLARVTAPVMTATSIYTRSASCAGLDFYPRDSVTEYGLAGAWIRSRTSGAGTGVFLCDPGLPNKAIVTKVQFTLVDNADSAEVKGCALVRGSLALTGGSLDVMASVSSTGLVPTPGAVRPTDATISNATINNASFGYWLQCQINQSGSLDELHIVGIIGADVIYTITGANG